MWWARKGNAMLTVHCPAHRTRVLIFTSGVEGVRNTAEGIEVDYRCTCGHRGTWLSGRRRRSGADAAARSAGAEYAVLRPLAAAAGGLA